MPAMPCSQRFEPATPASTSVGQGLVGERLAALGSKRALRGGDTLFEQGDEARQLFEILEGVVKLAKLLPDGRRQVIGFLYPGQLIGLAHADSHAYTAEALGAVTVRRYDRRSFEAVVDHDRTLRRRLMSHVSAELKAAQDHLLLLGRKTALERVAAFLLTLAERTPEGEAVDLPMSRQDIGDYLGLTLETVSRILGQLKAAGAIRLLTLRRLTILRRDELADVADADVADKELDLGDNGHRDDRWRRAAWPT